VPVHEFRKGGLGIDPDIFPHQRHVAEIMHLQDYGRCGEISDNYF
jgi:hypothetical protein